MSERTYPRDWTGLLPAETERWVQSGLISGEQRARILALYPRSGEAGSDRTILIFSILGSILLGAGVILFFAANWPAIPALVKVGAIIAATVGAYGAGYHLQYRRDYPRLGHSLIFLGGLLYGAGIWLVAQIYHMDGDFPAGFLVWGLGLLPVVWATASRPVLYLSTAVLLLWTINAQGQAAYNWLFPVVMLGAVLPITRRRAPTALVEAAVLGGLFLWFAINTMSHNFERLRGFEGQTLARLMLLYGATALAGGLARAGDERAWLGVGAALSLLGGYLLTFRWEVWMGGGEQAMPSLLATPAYTLTGAALLLAAAGAAGWLYWRRAEAGRSVLLPAILGPVVAAAGAHLLTPVPRMIIFNLLLFAATVGLIGLGVQRRSNLLVYIGLGAFVIHVLTRYFDLFFSAMDRSLFFVLGGALLLGGGWLLERNRRRWMNPEGGAGK